MTAAPLDIIAGLILFGAGIAIFGFGAWTCAARIYAGYSIPEKYRGEEWQDAMNSTWSTGLAFAAMAMAFLATIAFALYKSL